jgi:hypothetical protein
MSWEHLAGDVLTAAEHHPVPALLAAGAVVIGLRAATRTSRAGDGETVVIREGSVLAVLIAGAALIYFAARAYARPPAAHAAVRHTTIVQHVTKTPLLSGTALAWVIGVVAVLALIAFLNRSR